MIDSPVEAHQHEVPLHLGVHRWGKDHHRLRLYGEAARGHPHQGVGRVRFQELRALMGVDHRPGESIKA